MLFARDEYLDARGHGPSAAAFLDAELHGRVTYEPKNGLIDVKASAPEIIAALERARKAR